MFSRQCAGLQAWFEQASEHEACTRNTAFLRNFTLSLLPLPSFSSFLSPVPKPKRMRDDALGCWRSGVKEKGEVSDSKWEYCIDFSVFWIRPVVLKELECDHDSRMYSDSDSYHREDESDCWVQTAVFVCVCVCVHVFGARDSTNKSCLSTHWMNL